MWASGYWAKSYWAGRYWHPVSGIIDVLQVIARFVLPIRITKLFTFEC